MVLPGVGTFVGVVIGGVVGSLTGDTVGKKVSGKMYDHEIHKKMRFMLKVSPDSMTKRVNT